MREASPRLPPDPVVEAYKKDVDRSLFDRTLAMTPEERIRQLQALVRLRFELRRAGEAARDARPR
jgi:hypothetical protein